LTTRRDAHPVVPQAATDGEKGDAKLLAATANYRNMR
jgi:hypothetical protein